MVRVLSAWLLVFVCAIVWGNSVQVDPFVGEFKSSKGVITIRKEGETYKVKAVPADGGQTFEFDAKKEGNQISGSLIADGESVQVKFSVKGDTLTLIGPGGETVEFDRVVTEGNKPAAHGAGWKLLRHPLGLSMGYPGDWKVSKQDEGYLFIPPGWNESNPDEIIFVGGTDAEGIKSVSDPQLGIGVDFLVQSQLSQELKRTGSKKAADADGKGILFIYAGKTEMGQVEARVYVTLMKGAAIGLVAVMKPEAMVKRVPVLEKMFSTLREGKPDIDKNLLGSWSFMSETTIDAQSSGGRKPGDASLVSNTVKTITFSGDGTFVHRAQGSSIASGSGVFVENKWDDKNQGQWAAGDGVIVLIWDDGSSQEYTYRIDGNRLIARGGGKEITLQRN